MVVSHEKSVNLLVDSEYFFIVVMYVTGDDLIDSVIYILNFSNRNQRITCTILKNLPCTYLNKVITILYSYKVYSFNTHTLHPCFSAPSVYNCKLCIKYNTRTLVTAKKASETLTLSIFETGLISTIAAAIYGGFFLFFFKYEQIALSCLQHVFSAKFKSHVLSLHNI